MISDDNLLIHNYHLIITIFSFTLLFGDKLHRASYCHNKLLHLILLPSAPLPSLWPKSPESEQGVQDSIHWQPCFLQVQTGHSVSSAMRARYKSVWTDARTDSSLTSLTCTLYYTATTFMSVSVICTSMEDGMFLSRGVTFHYITLPASCSDGVTTNWHSSPVEIDSVKQGTFYSTLQQFSINSCWKHCC